MSLVNSTKELYDDDDEKAVKNEQRRQRTERDLGKQNS